MALLRLLARAPRVGGGVRVSVLEIRSWRPVGLSRSARGVAEYASGLHPRLAGRAESRRRRRREQIRRFGFLSRWPRLYGGSLGQGCTLGPQLPAMASVLAAPAALSSVPAVLRRGSARAPPRAALRAAPHPASPRLRRVPRRATPPAAAAPGFTGGDPGGSGGPPEKADVVALVGRGAFARLAVLWPVSQRRVTAARSRAARLCVLCRPGVLVLCRSASEGTQLITPAHALFFYV
jgi:hypothetical protein